MIKDSRGQTVDTVLTLHYPKVTRMERQRGRGGRRGLISAAAHFLEIFCMNIGSRRAGEDKRK